MLLKRELNFNKIVIFRSFQQSINELYDISHFKNEHVAFFHRVLPGQFKDEASAVASREKCTSLAEMFSIELTFTIDTLKYWFSILIKPNFLELDYVKKTILELQLQLQLLQFLKKVSDLRSPNLKRKADGHAASVPHNNHSLLWP